MPVKTAPIPNLRKFLIPDPGHTWIKGDLKGADVQAVAWDADCKFLKDFFKTHAKEGIGIHSYNAIAMYGERRVGQDGKKDPRLYAGVKARCHAYNYFATTRGLAKKLGSTVHYEDEFRNRWFSICPEIPKWQQRTEYKLERTKTIQNAFGFSRTYHEKARTILPEALAWLGQSTVSEVKNHAVRTLYLHYSHISSTPLSLLIDLHDEVGFQILDEYLPILPEIKEALHCTVPYSDPLIIPWAFKESRISWGDVK